MLNIFFKTVFRVSENGRAGKVWQVWRLSGFPSQGRRYKVGTL